MTDDKPSNAELAFGIGLLVAAIVLIYLGWDVMIYHGSWFSSGIAGVGVMVGGGDVETSREIADSIVAPEPTLQEQLLFYSGIIAILVNFVDLRTSIISSKLRDWS